MKKSLFILTMLIALAATQSVTISTSCTCAQMLTEADCGRISGCSWDTTKKTCAVPTTPTTPTTETVAAYCDQFTVAADCASANPCAWNGTACTHFTGCTAFTQTTNDKCAEISTRCITDGVHCIEKDACSTYQVQIACVVNAKGRYCFWNTTDVANPKCEDADDCPKLPATLNTDALCRAQLSKCTASAAGGCVESGTKCEDQVAEVGCVTNKDRSQACFWTSGKCLDKTCDNAVLTLITDQNCKDFVSTCTTKQGGGCVTRTTCGTATIAAACVKNSSGGDCFWNGTTCVDKTCANALASNKTNASCQTYLAKCITTGAGCVDNSGCDAAKIKDACDKTLSGSQCHWDGTNCKLKTCANAGSSYAGHDQCTTYMPTCTANGATGCTDRTCTNAPTTNNSNDLCKAYHPTGNCATKNGGGCRTNTTCEAIDLDSACVVDGSGRTCFWDGTCKTKTCTNSPTTNNSHALCQAFLPSCTVGSGSTCVDKTCENIQAEADCTTDLNSRACTYKGKCYQKQCALASKGITTHDDCQSYYFTCTLDNSGTGCMTLPLRCEAITQPTACKIKSGGGKCGLQGTSCVDQSCATAPVGSTYITTLACNGYKTGCVVNNNLDGCMDLPSTCAGRQKSENCEVEQARGLTDKCQWDNLSNLSSPVCIDVKCENAHLVTLKISVTQYGCWNYKSLKCVINSSNTCIPRPKTCAGLVRAACDELGVVEGNKDCYWDSGSSTCKDVACTSITFSNGTYTHDLCNAEIDTCTVNGNPGTSCVALKACNQYLENACKIGVNGNNCNWTGSACIDQPCSDAQDSVSIQYDSDAKCQSFSSLCTLAQKSCSSKKATCAEYIKSDACLMHTISGTQQCQWVSNACSNASFTCSSITGTGLTAGYCNKMSSSCSVNIAGTACIDAAANCSDYSATISDCKWSLTNKYCEVAGNKCVKDCSAAPAPYNTDSCKNYSSLCTLKSDGSGCVGIVDTCANTLISNCTYSLLGYCYNSGGSCISGFMTPVTSANCVNITGVGLTYNYCSGVSTGGFTCSVNATKTGCVVLQDSCASYSTSECSRSKNDGDCIWSSTRNCIKQSLAKCSDYAGTSLSACQSQKSSCTWVAGATTCSVNCASATGPFDYEYCKAYDLTCTVKLDGSGCVDVVDTCANTAIANCTSSEEGFCYPISGPACQVATTPLSNCTDINGKVRLTASYCKGISNNACSVLSDQTGCVDNFKLCSGYSNIADCFSSDNQKKCVLDAAGTACIAFNDELDACSAIKINGLTTNYTDYHCQLFKTSCKAKQDGTGCEDKVSVVAPACSSFTGANLAYYHCVDKLNTCSVNRDKNACVTAQNTCAAYTNLTECGYALNEGECVVSGTNCVPKSCGGADSSITDMAGCQAYSKNCILLAGGGCQQRAASCSSYTFQGACVKNSTGGNCLWNLTSKTCVDKTCSNAEATTNYNTHDKCAAIGNCTVKANADKTVGQGCISKAACSSYVNSEQCKFNNATPAGVCVWNENDAANPVCADKSCATASNLTNTSHDNCQTYLNTCTVDVVDVSGTLTPKGCIPLKPCSQYAEAQCYLSSEKNQSNLAIVCAWNGSACANKSCATAQSTVNTHALCSGYWSGCTVNATNDGCIVIPDKCEGMTKDQCFDGALDSNSKKCYWLDDTTGCVTRTCENSPNYATATECDAYLSGCTTDAVKCKTIICEDFPLTTDALCKAALSTCTSNGSICVARGTCSQAEAEAGCVNDSSQRLCQWVTPATGTAYCTLRTCNTAPSALTTEEQCKGYYTPSNGSCTTKKDGGCTVKGACTAATAEAACKTDNTGADCWWDTDKCRLKECKDFSGTTHAACKKIRSNCTVGLNGKCALMSNCEATTVRAACIEGNNGPCLWVNGACYSYESCKSLDWTSDSQCKKISPNCTTNGIECVGITSCAETNITGGCKTGTDGQCIQTLSAKGAADTICKKYTSCDAAYYLTHDECQVANPNCTSDYANGCIPLAACSAYTKVGQCNFNKDGSVTDTNGGITSTGVCQWDETASTCRDQQCQDIALTTEYECAARLKTCSTDGTNCIVKGACNSYTTDAACNKAGGTEGACFWVAATDTATASCRTKTCADIPNGTSTAACLGVANCVSNGINCIVKAACASYATKTGCQSSGTDGLCVWTEPVAPATVGKCVLMTGCASAKDETTCIQANNRCSWNSTTKACAEHTCDTYKTQVGSCKYFYTWDMKKYNICSTVSGKCVATDATTLPEGDCYTLTAYQYSWNPTSSKCAQCGTVIENINNSNNSNSTTNGTTTDSGYILPWTSAVLAYLIM